MAASGAVVEVENLEKVFLRGFFRRRTSAISGVSFQVEPGQVFGFLGPNGAGKTTTMKILMGLIHPTSGHARVLGRPVGDVTAKRWVGYLPENPYFYDYLTARELLQMVGRLYGLDAATRRKRSDELLERVGIAHAAHRPLRSYSKGMLQRTGLAQALMGEPKLVVLDEPMSGLDPIGRKEVRDLIGELRDRGTTVFFCTHILADADLLCDRVAIIVKGKIREEGLLGELLGSRVLSVDVRWRGDDELRGRLLESHHEARHRRTPEGEHAVFGDQESAGRFAAAVVDGGGALLQVTPHRQTLEELFVKDAEAAAGEARD